MNDLRLDVERRQIRQDVVEAARQPGGGFRFDDLLEVPQIGVEVPDDIEAERERGGEDGRREGREEERQRGDEHQLDEDQEERLQERRIDARARPTPAWSSGGVVQVM